MPQVINHEGQARCLQDTLVRILHVRKRRAMLAPLRQETIGAG
jgi:hypothetical protein